MANTYLQRTASGTDGTNSQRKNTISMWLKRSSLSDACFIEGQGNDANATQVYFDSNTKLTVNHVSGNSSLNFQIVTNRVFRDTSAWYHFVITIDTTLGTAADRVKIYVNGVRETSFSSASYPGQNATTQLLARLNLNIIGRRKSGGVGLYFDGSMSHVHVTDGTVYQASTFGSTDSTTGEWKINTSPSVTYGNNGFFILKDGNTITDSSTNSNNFSLSGGTLTNTKDCPDNVMATLNPLDGVISLGNSTFTYGNTRWNSETASNYCWTRSTLGMTSGKYYFEAKIETAAEHMYIGISDRASPSTSTFFGTGAYDYAYKSSSGAKKNSGNESSYGNTWTANNIVMCAVDLDNLKIYFGKDGTWQNSGNPASGSTGTGAAFTITTPSSTTSGDYFFCLADGASGGSNVRWNSNFGNGYFGTTAVSSAGTNASGNGIFEYDVPSGYTALSTKGLNT